MIFTPFLEVVISTTWATGTPRHRWKATPRPRPAASGPPQADIDATADAQQGENILHMRAVEELQPAEFHEGNVAA
ncbi:hypothetical protein, partial [Methylosinus sp. R-45379]|uniref:hypothetical protein n=1 Tax=Methylosinus sp. R-45379 TaxID=980563 RepID=UPI001FD90D78